MLPVCPILIIGFKSFKKAKANFLDDIANQTHLCQDDCTKISTFPFLHKIIID